MWVLETGVGGGVVVISRKEREAAREDELFMVAGGGRMLRRGWAINLNALVRIASVGYACVRLIT